MQAELINRFKNQKDIKVAEKIIEKIIKKGDDISWRKNPDTKALLASIDRQLIPFFQGYNIADLKERIPKSSPYFSTVVSILDCWAEWNTNGKVSKQASSFVKTLTPKKALILYFVLCPIS